MCSLPLLLPSFPPCLKRSPRIQHALSSLPPFPQDLECTLPLPFRDTQAAAGSVHALTEDLQRCLQFQQEDDGHSPCYMLRMECGLKGGQEGGKKEGIFSCAINKAFQQAFRPALALLDDVVTHRALQSLVFTG